MISTSKLVPRRLSKSVPISELVLPMGILNVIKYNQHKYNYSIVSKTFDNYLSLVVHV